MLTAYIGMGANLPSPVGSPEATLAASASRVASLGRIIDRSSLYSTEPVGFADQPCFTNAVLALETDLAPHALLDHLLAIELEFGRDRSAGLQNGPRTLDLDILLMGDLSIHESGLEIPHPRLAERTFVLIPLNEVAPQAVDPRTRKNVAQLLQTLLEHSESEAHAVVPIQSDVWRTSAGSGAAHSAGRPCAESREPHRHRILELPFAKHLSRNPLDTYWAARIQKDGSPLNVRFLAGFA
jgi:2-amino-4-hydroxy-6-hydroxymethyldihydropteridine diphosphokinase